MGIPPAEEKKNFFASRFPPLLSRVLLDVALVALPSSWPPSPEEQEKHNK